MDEAQITHDVMLESPPVLRSNSPIFKKKYYLIAAIGTIIIIIVGFGSWFLYTKQKSQDKSYQAQTKKKNEKVSQTMLFSDPVLSGSQVTALINGKRATLFENVEGISQVRIGPDGKSMHFRSESVPLLDDRFCANLTEVDKPALSDNENPPPQSPPWDFKRIGTAYTINSCYGNGYVPLSNYFIYVQVRTPKEIYLVYEDVTSGKKQQISITPEMLKNIDNGKSEASSGIVGYDKYRYIYPEKAIKVGNKLVLAFDRYILGINIDKNKVIGEKKLGSQPGEDDFGIVADAFTFKNKNTQPLVLIDAGWESSAWIAGVIDVSGDMWKIEKTAYLDKRPKQDFGVEPVVWEKGSILFNFTDFEDIPIPESFINDRDLLTMSDAAIAILSHELENKLIQEGKYNQVKCDLRPGMYTPLCENLKGVNQYRYTAGKGLVKL